jgi:hemerythrin
MNTQPDSQPYLRWTDRFSVGVPELDEDHRALVCLVNEACAAWTARERGRLRTIMDSLNELAAAHFEREEGVLRSLPEYRLLASHVDEHQNRLRQLEAIQKQVSEPGVQLESVPLSDKLINWFVRQTIGHDSAIKAYFDDGRAG